MNFIEAIQLLNNRVADYISRRTWGHRILVLDSTETGIVQMNRDKTLQYGVISVADVLAEDWEAEIKTFPFEAALGMLRKYKGVKRVAWPADQYLYITDGPDPVIRIRVPDCINDVYDLPSEDVLAEDWCCVLRAGHYPSPKEGE